MGIMETWYEEDEPVFVYPCDPHVWIYIRESARPVQVVIGGETVAATRRARFLLETGKPTRYYIPQEDVYMARLETSPTQAGCPYKGIPSTIGQCARGSACFQIWYGVTRNLFFLKPLGLRITWLFISNR